MKPCLYLMILLLQFTHINFTYNRQFSKKMMNWDPFAKNMKTPMLSMKLRTSQNRKLKFARTKSSKTQKAEGINMNILAMLIRKVVKRNQKQLFIEFKQKVIIRAEIKNRMISIINSNLHTCKILAWHNLRKNWQTKRISVQFLKNVLNLSYRFYQQGLGYSFHKIYWYSEKRKQKEIQILQSSKGVILCSIIKRLQLKRKQQAFNRILKCKNVLKKLKKKLKIINLVHAKLQKLGYQKAFNIIRRFAYEQQMTSQNSPTQKHQRLKFQIEDMVIQIQNKNQSIGRLTKQLNMIRRIANQQNESRQNMTLISNKSFDRLSFKSNQSREYKQQGDLSESRNSRDFSRKSSIQNRSERQFSVTSQDYNLGSILDSSFVSLGSNRSRSIFDRPDGDCNCQYRYKYLEYKSLYETHKNQLDILRKELQVSKDLNEHFQNELKFYSENQDHQEIQKLKTLAKEAQKQRENLREKVYKYQKYIASLKMELRQKMQDLYRKVKKQQ